MDNNLDDIQQLSRYIHTITKNIENIDNQLNNSKQFTKLKCDTINENEEDDSPIIRKFNLIQHSTNESDSEIQNPFLRRFKIKKQLSLQAPSINSNSHNYFSNNISMTDCRIFPSVHHKREISSIYEDIKNINEDNENRNMSDCEEDKGIKRKMLSKRNSNNNTKSNKESINSKSKSNAIIKKKKPIKLLLSNSIRKHKPTNKVYNVTQLNNSTLSTPNVNMHLKKNQNLNISAYNNSTINTIQNKILRKKKSSRNIQHNNDSMIQVNNNNNSIIASLRMSDVTLKRKHKLNYLENSCQNNWTIKSAKTGTKTDSFQKTISSITKTHISSVPKTKRSSLNTKHRIVTSSSQINKRNKQSYYLNTSTRLKTSMSNKVPPSIDSLRLSSARKPKHFSQPKGINNQKYKGINIKQFNEMITFIKIINDKTNGITFHNNNINKCNYDNYTYKVIMIQRKWRKYFIRKHIMHNNKHIKQNISMFCINYLFNELYKNDNNYKEFINQLNKLNDIYSKCIKGKKFLDIQKCICENNKASIYSKIITVNIKKSNK